MDDIILQKVASMEKCIQRVYEEASHDWKEDYTHQDALLLNVERACQLSIDIASHYVKSRKLGLPNYSRELFDLMKQKGVIDEDLATSLKSMEGFRNLIVHDYNSLDLAILESIIFKHLDDLKVFGKIMLKPIA